MQNYNRLILALTDDELERFVRDWVDSKKANYHEVEKFTGAGDMGRDVVGFKTNLRHDGEWHNYQCKQYSRPLSTENGINEIGKIIYYASEGAFTLPEEYIFVAPKGVNRNLEKLIFRPSEFRNKLISEWDKYCARSIVKNNTIGLTTKIIDAIEKFNFSGISRINADALVQSSDSMPVLFRWFSADPGPAPDGSVPIVVRANESAYIQQLLKVYAERMNKQNIEITDLTDQLKNHLQVQRVRFYDADAFKRFYRDNTDVQTMNNFDADMYYGIIDEVEKEYSNAMDRISTVMSHAAKIHVSGVLSKYAKSTVKQGTCHHFANEGKIRWTP